MDHISQIEKWATPVNRGVCRFSGSFTGSFSQMFEGAMGQGESPDAEEIGAGATG